MGAHDGENANGWIRLLTGGHLASKWGVGSWAFLNSKGDSSSSRAPLMLVIFHGVEHCVRLVLPSNDAAAADADTKDVSTADVDTKDASAADVDTKDAFAADADTKDASATEADEALAGG